MAQIQILPANPPDLRGQELTSVIAQLLQVIAAQKQQRRESDIMKLLSGATPETFPGLLQQYQQQPQPGGLGGLLQGLNPLAPSRQPSGLEGLIAQQQMQNLTDPTAALRRRYIQSRIGATEALAEKRTAEQPAKPMTVTSLKSFGQNMDELLKPKRWGRTDWPKQNLLDAFETWKEKSGYSDMPETQKKQLWALWKSKVKAKGNEAEFDPTDPEWQTASELGGALQKPVSGKVTMLAPDGNRYTVDQSDIDECIKRGWTLVR